MVWKKHVDVPVARSTHKESRRETVHRRGVKWRVIYETFIYLVLGWRERRWGQGRVRRRHVRCHQIGQNISSHETSIPFSHPCLKRVVSKLRETYFMYYYYYYYYYLNERKKSKNLLTVKHRRTRDTRSIRTT
jgi:hypothetical protein